MIGELVAHYRILDELGRGGMGDVYKAEDTKLKRPVALKFLPLPLTNDPETKIRQNGGNLMKKRLILILIALSLPASLFAGTSGKISGTIAEKETGEPLQGANVFIKGTTLGAASNADGSFTIENVPPGSYAVVTSFIGFKTLETAVRVVAGETATVNFMLPEDAFRTEEIVVTGIASRTAKATAEVAVSRLDVAELTETQTYESLSQLLSGKVAGVQMAQATAGNLGSAFRFDVRSGGGLNGDEQPVIYLDGVRLENSRYDVGPGTLIDISTLLDLNPEDIEKIEVLKGPAAAASYGTRGANGVVLITTKRGRLVRGDKAYAIDYKSVMGWNTPHKWSAADGIIQETADRLNNAFRNGQILHNSINITGGSESIQYYTSFDQKSEEGYNPNDAMDRYAVRANLDAFPSDKFDFSVSAGYTLTDIATPQESQGGSIYSSIMFSAIPYFFGDSAAVHSLKFPNTINHFIGSVAAEYRPFKGLAARLSVGIDESDNRGDWTYAVGLNFGGTIGSEGLRVLSERNSRQLTFTSDARYSYSLWGLDASSAIGVQLFDRKFHYTVLGRQGFLTDKITDISAGSEIVAGFERREHTREAGVFAEQSLSYKETYFGRFMLRRDYATVIGIEAPSIIYPQVSGAVRLDRLGVTPSWFDLLKLRAAYGESGVLPQRTDGIAILWEASQSAYGAGAEISNIGNPEIKPERIKEFEIGLDTEMFSRYAVDITYYRQNATNSIIGYGAVPSSGRIGAVPTNVGSIKGWGIESHLQASLLRSRNYRLDLSLINSYRENEVVSLGGADPLEGSVNIIREGFSKYEFYAQRVIDAKFDENGVYIGPNVTDGKVRIGSSTPKYTGSFSLHFQFLKNFHFSALTEWKTAFYIWSLEKLNQAFLGHALGVHVLQRLGELEAILDTAAPGSPEYIAAAEEYAPFDRNVLVWGSFVEPADFFTLREVSLSYNLRDLLLGLNVGRFVQNLTLGISAQNLFLTTKFSGVDPESFSYGIQSLSRNLNSFTLPRPRIYQFWVRVGI